MRAGLGRYVAHNPKAWNAEFETYTRIRYSWTLSADWPRLAMVQALIGQMLYADPVVYDWAHIQVPTLAFGGAEDMLLGPAARFQERMQALAKTIPNGNGRVLLLAGSRPRAAPRGAREGAAAARRVPQGGAGGEVGSARGVRYRLRPLGTTAECRRASVSMRPEDPAGISTPASVAKRRREIVQRSVIGVLTRA